MRPPGCGQFGFQDEGLLGEAMELRDVGQRFIQRVRVGWSGGRFMRPLSRFQAHR
jgi:hypothetical protein